MSSFVVSKEEYIKAAGIMAGLSDMYSNTFGSHRLWIYDYEKGRNMTAEDYHRAFSDCHTMNALSVQEQYDDETPETDSDDYMDTFNEYRAKIKKIAHDRAKMQNVILSLHSFFRCAEYQTENQSYYWKMTTFFNRINAALLPFMVPARETAGWGRIEIG